MSTSLSELIEHVRNELVAADLKRQEEGRESLLELDQLQIEIHFVVTSTDKVKGGFDLKVLSLGGEDEYREEEVQTVRVTLKKATGESESGPAGSRFKKKRKGKKSDDVAPL